MKRARVGMIATAILAVATMAFAQKPDFSGTWTPDARQPRRQATPAAAVAAAAGAWRPDDRQADRRHAHIERTMGENKVAARPTSSTAPRARTRAAAAMSCPRRSGTAASSSSRPRPTTAIRHRPGPWRAATSPSSVPAAVALGRRPTRRPPSQKLQSPDLGPGAYASGLFLGAYPSNAARNNSPTVQSGDRIDEIRHPPPRAARGRTNGLGTADAAPSDPPRPRHRRRRESDPGRGSGARPGMAVSVRSHARSEAARSGADVRRASVSPTTAALRYNGCVSRPAPSGLVSMKVETRRSWRRCERRSTAAVSVA